MIFWISNVTMYFGSLMASPSHPSVLASSVKFAGFDQLTSQTICWYSLPTVIAPSGSAMETVTAHVHHSLAGCLMAAAILKQLKPDSIKKNR
jgi:hypothetical protein